LNGKEGRVGDKTKKKIEKAIEDLHYTRSNAAISLSTGKSHLSDFSKNPFYGEFMASFQEEAGKSSYDVVIGGIRTETAFEQWVSSRHFDAVVLFGFYPQAVFSFIMKRKIPAALFSIWQALMPKTRERPRQNDAKILFMFIASASLLAFTIKIVENEKQTIFVKRLTSLNAIYT
jgi:hypothetical protein